MQFTAYNEKLIINSNNRYIWVLTPCFQNNEGEGDRGLASKQRGGREQGTGNGSRGYDRPITQGKSGPGCQTRPYVSLKTGWNAWYTASYSYDQDVQFNLQMVWARVILVDWICSGLILVGCKWVHHINWFDLSWMQK